MEIKTTKPNATTTIIELFGDIDLDSSPAVRKTILALTQKKIKHLIVNLAGVNYMDSSGVATMVEGLQCTNEYQGQFTLVGLGAGVLEVFELSRLDRVFTIFPDVQQALAKVA